MIYEAQATTMTHLIKQLKQEKHAIEERVQMGIKRIWLIVGGRRERMRTIMEECSTAV